MEITIMWWKQAQQINQPNAQQQQLMEQTPQTWEQIAQAQQALNQSGLNFRIQPIQFTQPQSSDKKFQQYLGDEIKNLQAYTGKYWWQYADQNWLNTLQQRYVSEGNPAPHAPQYTNFKVPEASWWDKVKGFVSPGSRPTYGNGNEIFKSFLNTQEYQNAFQQWAMTPQGQAAFQDFYKGTTNLQNNPAINLDSVARSDAELAFHETPEFKTLWQQFYQPRIERETWG